MKKQILSLTIALLLCVGLAVPAGAYDTGKTGEHNVTSVGAWHSAAIDENGDLWTQGGNIYGMLGNGTTERSSTPVKVLDNVASVQCGRYQTAAIKTDGSLWMWGFNGLGGLGNSGKGNATAADGYTIQTTPVKVMDDVAAVSTGHAHTAAIKTDGSLWMWGRNRFGQLGNGGEGDGTTPSGYLFQSTPVKVMDNVVAVSCGYEYTAAVTTDGALWMWGDNTFAQLGIGFVEDYEDEDGYICQTTPMKVLDNVTTVSCGLYHTAVIKTDGSLWMWGINSEGELGNGGGGDYMDEYGGVCQTTPVKVMDNVAAVSCGLYHTAVIKADHSLWMCGYNNLGQLGNDGVGDLTDEEGGIYQFAPMQILENVAAVNCGEWCTAAVKADGSLWMWGSNVNGELGNGGEANATDKDGNIYQSIPIKVMDKVAAIDGDTAPAAPAIPATGTAHPATQMVEIDGKKVEFQMYALKDADGSPTNYVKVRDLALALNGTKAQFAVGWDGAVNLEPGKAYAPNGSENKTPYSGEQAYTVPTSATSVNGAASDLQAIVLTDANGGGYTYYKLRDLGKALGFNVDFSGERGVFIETDKPYSGT